MLPLGSDVDKSGDKPARRQTTCSSNPNFSGVEFRLYRSLAGFGDASRDSHPARKGGINMRKSWIQGFALLVGLIFLTGVMQPQTIKHLKPDPPASSRPLTVIPSAPPKP